MDEQIQDNGHHRFSPSALEALEGCPCYTSEESEDNTAADEGTLLHEAVENHDLSKLETEEQHDLVLSCLGYENQLVAWMRAEYTGEAVKILHEGHVKVGELTEGTLDLVVTAGNKAHIVDWKFGRVPVTGAPNNPQVQAYSAGVFEAFPEITEIVAHIYQPRLNAISRVDISRDQLPDIVKRIRDIIEACQDEDKVPTPSEKSCTYCSAKATCQALNNTALTITKQLPLQMPAEFNPGTITNPVDMSKALTIAKIMEDWAKQVKRIAKSMVLEDGEEIPGYALRKRSGATKVVEPYLALQKVAETYDVPIPTLLQSCSVSLPRLVDQVVCITGGTKKDAREKLLSELSDMVIQEEDVTYLQKSKGK